jgi:hypothetical protein
MKCTFVFKYHHKNKDNMADSTLATSTILITSIGSVVGGMVGAYLIAKLSKLKTKTISVYNVNNEKK